jgi:hypothetical protein
MAMVCPQCAGYYEQRLQCPTCGVRLLYDLRGPKTKPNVPAIRWQQTPAGRTLIGLVMAQGLYFGLQHLVTGLLEVLNNQGLIQWTWTSLSGLLFLQILQVLTLMAGAMLAGGGQERGVMLGALVGVWNGVLSVLLDPLLHPQFVPTLTTLTLIGVPLVHIAVGTVGGWIGYTVWQPVRLSSPIDPSRPARKAGVAPRKGPVLAGHIVWFRVALGAVVAAAGYLTAAALYSFIIDFSAGKLTSDGFWQDRLATWEIQSLAVMLGGAVAGYNTRNGLTHGMCVGGLTSGFLLVALLGFARVAPEAAAVAATACLCLCLVGGWFGSQLFPPLVPERPRNLGPAPLA